MAKNAYDHIAGDYARYRPTYPPCVTDWITDLLQGHPPPAGASQWIADVAAGTGNLATSLACGGWRVVAVDASAAMLRAGGVGGSGVAGLAEALPLADGSCRAVVVSQAMHWLNPRLAIPELARVLIHGCPLVLASYTRDADDPFTRSLDRWVRRWNPAFRREMAPQDWPAWLGASGLFELVSLPQIPVQPSQDTRQQPFQDTQQNLSPNPIQNPIQENPIQDTQQITSRCGPRGLRAGHAVVLPWRWEASRGHFAGYLTTLSYLRNVVPRRDWQRMREDLATWLASEGGRSSVSLNFRITLRAAIRRRSGT